MGRHREAKVFLPEWLIDLALLSCRAELGCLRLGALEEQLLLQRCDESVDVCRLLEIVRLLAAELPQRQYRNPGIR
jgi:hypothetical protein